MSLPLGQDQLCGPSNLLSTEYEEFFSGGKLDGAKNRPLTAIQHHLMPRLRMCETTPPFPHMSSWYGDNYPLQCTLVEVRTLKKEENIMMEE